MRSVLAWIKAWFQPSHPAPTFLGGRTIKLMADYQCSPLWEASPGLIGSIDPESLPISDELCAALTAWGYAFDETLNFSDPASSGFLTKQQHLEFIAQGDKLAARLRSELGPTYRVITNFS